MKPLFEALRRDESVEATIRAFGDRDGECLVYGLTGAQKHTVFAAAFEASPRRVAIITTGGEELSSWRADLATLLPGAMIYELPETDNANFRVTAKSFSLLARRMDILGYLTRKEPVIVLARAAAAAERGISRRDFQRLSLHIRPHARDGREKIISRLIHLGYERVAEAGTVGEFSVRGGILDIFPINSLLPVRVEFFDEEIESIREFSPESRLSVRPIREALILPIKGGEGAGTGEAFTSFVGNGGCVIFDEPARLRESIINITRENPELVGRFLSWEELVASAKESNVIYSALMPQKIAGAEPQNIYSITSKSATAYQRQTSLFAADAKAWIEAKQRVVVMMDGNVKSVSVRETLRDYDIPTASFSLTSPLSPGLATVADFSLTGGFELPGAGLVVVTEREILGHQKKRLRLKTAPSDAKISHFRDIRAGDYVVHVNHGIGKYIGVVTMEVAGARRDYLHIKYGGDDKLFVPTDQVNLLQKFIGSEGEAPHLSKLSSSAWAKAKAKAKVSAETIAKDLVNLYAKRRETKGFAFPKDTPWQREFEEAFAYEETADQLTATREIKSDMEKPVPMDRLLCGDVGFGKTEVAIRAAFKAVMGKKQVAVLVPTTVLAEQHYQTFSERLKDFGPTVEVICRFRTAKEQRETLKRVKEGRTDILIGTHAILNQRRTEFFDLGLLIVDEEQRFGVKQKEKIKKIALGIDVLTLSATPIPRTLHMSLVGARDMSVIETPPEERCPIQTYVIEANDEIISRAIRREMRRGGQVYFVYNRIESMGRMMSHLTSLVPEARIRQAHGQMPEDVLEEVMMDFYEGRYDVLLATSIVENGLDVANANTIIVYNADSFGLAQLYQMRGRVGRSKEMAFAYLVYQRDKVLTETAERRLQAMKEFAELGAGFRIAMRDLELRGAGNLLGAEQHGHIASVGFEMYMSLLDDAIKSLQTGKTPEPAPDPSISLPVEAYIDGGYIEDAMHKIEAYQRIAAIRSEEDVLSLTRELTDRFGAPSASVRKLLDIARIKNLARRLGAKSVMEKGGFIEVTLADDHKLAPENFIAVKKRLGRLIETVPAHHLIRAKKKSGEDSSAFTLSLLTGLCGGG